MPRCFVLYHYTDDYGHDGIMHDGVIEQSEGCGNTGKPLKYGDGVYLTSISPDAGKYNIALNNYRGRNLYEIAEAKCQAGMLDWAIEVWIPRWDNRIEKIWDDGRDLWVYRGNIDLDYFDYNVYETDD